MSVSYASSSSMIPEVGILVNLLLWIQNAISAPYFRLQTFLSSSVFSVFPVTSLHPFFPKLLSHFMHYQLLCFVTHLSTHGIFLACNAVHTFLHPTDFTQLSVLTGNLQVSFLVVKLSVVTSYVVSLLVSALESLSSSANI